MREGREIEKNEGKLENKVWGFINPCPAEPGYTLSLQNSVDPDQLASEEASWSGFALFVIQ